MKKLLRKLRRAIRRRQSDIVKVYCPHCWEMTDAYTKHWCPSPVIVDEIGEMRGYHIFKR